MDNRLEFWQAMKLVSEGKKVSRIGWTDGVYVQIHDTSYSVFNKNGMLSWWSPIGWDMTAGDWFEVES